DRANRVLPGRGSPKKRDDDGEAGDRDHRVGHCSDARRGDGQFEIVPQPTPEDADRVTNGKAGSREDALSQTTPRYERRRERGCKKQCSQNDPDAAQRFHLPTDDAGRILHDARSLSIQTTETRRAGRGAKQPHENSLPSASTTIPRIGLKRKHATFHAANAFLAAIADDAGTIPYKRKRGQRTPSPFR